MDAIAAMWPSDGEQSVDGHGTSSHAILHGAVQVTPFESPAQHSAGASAAIAAKFWPENDTSDGTEDQQSPAALLPRQPIFGLTIIVLRKCLKNSQMVTILK